MGNSDSLTDPMEFRSLISIRCCPVQHLQGPPVLPHMASPACRPCYPGVHLSVLAVFVRTGTPAFLCKSESRQLQFFTYEATSKFAFTTTRRLAQLPYGTFVRELSASGYP